MLKSDGARFLRKTRIWGILGQKGPKWAQNEVLATFFYRNWVITCGPNHFEMVDIMFLYHPAQSACLGKFWFPTYGPKRTPMGHRNGPKWGFSDFCQNRVINFGPNHIIQHQTHVRENSGSRLKKGTDGSPIWPKIRFLIFLWKLSHYFLLESLKSDRCYGPLSSYASRMSWILLQCA